METTTPLSDTQRLEAQIVDDANAIGIDVLKAHVLILSKLESIERRLDRLEQASDCADAGRQEIQSILNNAMAATTDTVDDAIARLSARGVEVDARLRDVLRLTETLTDERVLSSIERIVGRVDALEQLSEFAANGPQALAAIVDTFDDEVQRATERGIDVDTALRNGLTAMLYLGQRVSTNELEALGALLRSDVLHPNAVDVVGRLGAALVAAADVPARSVGPVGAIAKLGDRDTRRSTAFVLEFSRRFGAALSHRKSNSSTTKTERSHHD